MYYPYSENKGADQLRSYCAADLRLCFRICKNAGFLTTRLKCIQSGLGMLNGLNNRVNMLTTIVLSLKFLNMILESDSAPILMGNVSSSPATRTQFEPRYEKTGFLHMSHSTKVEEFLSLKQILSFLHFISLLLLLLLSVAAKLISDFVFSTRIVQSLFFLNPKFQASSHLLWLYSPVCVRAGRKPRRPVFSQRGSFH